MKNLKKYIPIILSMIFLSSCIDTKFNAPEEAVYNPGLTANTTIKELRDLFVEETLVPIETDVIILGTVTANDKTGNFYKSIVIQDSTAAIQIDLDAYELHNKYHVGDLVYIKCKGLFVGDYGGEAKLGSDYEGSIGRVAFALIDDYLFKADGGIPIEPKLVSLFPISPSLVNQLIRFEDVQFGVNSLGLTYGDADNQIDRDIPLENCDDYSTIVRTSGYSDFARDTIASGNGNLTAILSIYNGENQLKLRDPNEIVFNNERCGTVFLETFEESLGTFTPYSVIGDNQVWTYDASYGAVMSGFVFDDFASYENEDWLISSAIDLTEHPLVALNFRHALNYITSNGYNDTEVWICDDYDGSSNPNTSGTWEKIPTLDIIYPPGDSYAYISSGNINISDYGNNSSVFIAFKYSSSNADACTWELDNIAVKAL